ncbi:hypothetical protein R3P38DRAFT_2859852 [Favolaschia claudopus]|uniref:Uncharacterized protein n=1 Tax=Favolaschia claudopus TaxID=2862362 RepID=A0AAW0DM98_9AGAR
MLLAPAALSRLRQRALALPVPARVARPRPQYAPVALLSPPAVSLPPHSRAQAAQHHLPVVPHRRHLLPVPAASHNLLAVLPPPPQLVPAA